MKTAAPRTVALADLLSGQEAAVLAGISYANLRVKLGLSQFPPPVRTQPNLWLRQDVEGWKQTKR
jgi:hypothetical protein